MNHRADVFTHSGAIDVFGIAEIENKHRSFIIPAHGGGGHIHNIEILFENVEIRKTFIHFCIVKPVGILVVNSVHIGGLEDYVGVDLGGAKGGAGIGREEGASGSASENYHSPLFKVTYGAASDVRLRNCWQGMAV